VLAREVAFLDFGLMLRIRDKWIYGPLDPTQLPRYLCGGQGGSEGLFGGGSQSSDTVTVTVSVGPCTVVVTTGPGTVVVVAGPGTVVVVVGPGTVVVTVGPGTDTVSVSSDTVVVTAGPGTVVVVVGPGKVRKVVVVRAGAVSPGALVRVIVSPVTVVVSRTIRASPGTVRSRVVHSTS
jgi:hypothetical protein